MKKSNLSAAVVMCLLMALPVFAQKTNPPAKKTPPPAKQAEKAPVKKAEPSKPNEDLVPKSAPVSVAEEVEAIDEEAFAPKPIDTTLGLSVIAFGSCNKVDKTQLWADVAANNPTLWVWLGDIIYADTSNMKALAAHYKRLKTHPDYKKMRAKAQVIGVYDDHDYGINDGCKDYPFKKGAKKCLMDFLDVPLNSPLRKREGAYSSYTFGKGTQRIKVIVMDTRYFRDTLQPDPTKQRRYIPNTTGSMLGETQWKWLEKELRNSQANLNILCSSVQVVSDEHPHEKWGNFPNERKRLLSLIAQTKPKNLLILSGDRHMTEVSKMDIQGLPYPLYDFTSSGMTHIRSGTSEPNKFRVGNMIVKKNFGILKIYWVNDKPVVTMQARGPKNELYQEITVKY